jgi:hypothetical protein
VGPDLIALVLPFPPSVNRYWRVSPRGRGVLLSKEGREYRRRVRPPAPPSFPAPVPRPTISSRRPRFSSPADMTSSLTAWRTRADLLE